MAEEASRASRTAKERNEAKAKGEDGKEGEVPSKEAKRAARASSNVFSMFKQSEIQEFKEAAKRAKEPKRAQRATSNVFSMFKQSEIQEFKEAFTMIDQNRDGFIDVEDLKDMYASLGRIPADNVLDGMVKEAPGPLNFTMFLTIFGEKLCGQEPKTDTLKAMLKECPGQLNFTAFLTLFGEKAHGTDPESTIMNAFQMFDDDNKGMLDEEYVKDLLQNVGDIFTKDEMKQTWKEAPVSGGKFDYKQMVKLLKGQGSDPENTILNAFAMFDADNTGVLEEEYVKDLLENMGDNFTKEEIKQTWKEAPIAGGQFDYRKFVRLVKRGDEEDI